ncbi:MAG: ABC transporter ATP-binding protein [Candidatus Omnitrophica bacterium]|nr:ABC transporter ATP-binding protein [Candidatus Omnitrophota bacterium]
MIGIVNLCKRFGEQTVLDHVNLEIRPGEIFFILGGSGSGKSVLLKHMLGLLRPDSGRVLINDQDITAMPEEQLLRVRAGAGYLFQDGALYDFMNVFDNVAFPLREHTRLPGAQIRERVREVLVSLDLKGVENKMPAELSGGMKKRVGLGRAIILGAKILFCDEPTSGLVPIRSRDISDLIRQVARRLNCTTVVTSHDMRNAFRIADRLALLQDGRIAALGTRPEWEHSANPAVQAFLQ